MHNETLTLEETIAAITGRTPADSEMPSLAARAGCTERRVRAEMRMPPLRVRGNVLRAASGEFGVSVDALLGVTC